MSSHPDAAAVGAGDETPPDTSGFRARQLTMVIALAGFAGASVGGWRIHPGWTLLAGISALALALLVPLLRIVRSRARVVIVALVIIAGCARGTAAHTVPAIVPSNTTEILVGVVSSTDTPGVVVDVDQITNGLGTRDVGGRILLSGRNLRTLTVGDRVAVTASALKAAAQRPGARSVEALDRDGIDVIALVTSVSVNGVVEEPQRWLAVVRDSIRGAVNGVLPQPGSSLVLGVAMGIHQPVDAATHATLQDAGLYHVVAVSGLKVIIVLGLLDAVGTALRWPPRRRRAVGLLGVAAYVLLSGAGAAALRSSAMATIGFLVRRDGRRLDPFVGLAMTAALLCGIEPAIALDVGFQLSFAGTAGILLLAPWLQARIPLAPVIADPLAVTVAAQLATTPIIAATFGVVSLVGPIANAAVLPLLPLMIALGVVGSLLAVGAPVLAWLPLHLSAILCDLTVGVAGVLAALPFAALHVGQWPAGWVLAEVAGLVVGTVTAVVAIRRLRFLAIEWRIAVTATAAAMTALLAMALSAIPDGVPRVIVLDVGAAPAVLIETGDGARILVDTGATAASLDSALGRVLSPLDTQIDLLVLTASDPHAVGGLGGLPGHYSVKRVVVPVAFNTVVGQQLAALQATGTTVVTGTSAWQWGSADWRCLGSDPDAAAVGCLLTVTADSGWRLLIAGVSPTAIQDEVAGMGRAQLGADLLVAPPGGALTQPFLDAVRPSYIADPTAVGGRHLLPGAGIAVATTGTDGDLRFSVVGTGFVRD